MNKIQKFEKICRDIKDLKIQGAEQVAKAAVLALLLKHDNSAIKRLISLRPTEPCLRNCLSYCLSFPNIEKGVRETIKIMEEARKKIIKIGANLIEDDMIVFTHCHSSTVISILIEAKKLGKKFQVYNTETRPNFQGRITAKELLKKKIPVTMFIDSAANSALKEADIFLFGLDAITSQGSVINKIGNKVMAEIANKYDVPCYACSFSWKFDPKTIFGEIEKLEKRSPEEVWPNKPKNLKIRNIIFEEIPPELITAIISELGILKPANFISEFRAKYPAFFQNKK